MSKLSDWLAGCSLPLFLKSHVKGYTRADGTQVKEHDDNRQKAAPTPPGGPSHPHIVGKVDYHRVHAQGKVGDAKGDGDPTHPATAKIGFAGKEYQPTGKTGTSMHDDTPVHHFEADDGHEVWADKEGNVHADSADEVDRLRQRYKAYHTVNDEPELPDDQRFGGGVEKTNEAMKGDGKNPLAGAGAAVPGGRMKAKGDAKPTPADAGAAAAAKDGAKPKPKAKPRAKPKAEKPAAGATEASLKQHPMFSQSDYDYFVGKGYTPEDIKVIWDRDHAAGNAPVQHKQAPNVTGVVGNPDLYKSIDPARLAAAQRVSADSLPGLRRMILPAKVASPRS